MSILEGSTKLFFGLFLCCVTSVSAERTVLGTVTYVNHGEHTPLLITDPLPFLTTTGANQLSRAGSKMRSIYIDPLSNSSIQDIGPTMMRLKDLDILATPDGYSDASAQAFMQALYPPLSPAGNWSQPDWTQYLANGTRVQGPQGSMQYPAIVAPLSTDSSSVWLQGASGCPAFSDKIAGYFMSAQYNALDQNSSSFYEELREKYFEDVPLRDFVSYAYAYHAYEYLNFQNTHNQTFAERMDPADLTTAKIYADDWVYSIYANTSDTGKVGDDALDAIAGRTFASRVLSALQTTVIQRGETSKMSLIFGDYRAMVSFAALAQLIQPRSSNFYKVPAPGASYTFELFTYLDNPSSYPDSGDLFVRFLYTNGTEDDDTTIEYSLFGNSPSGAVMPYSDFTSEMTRIAVSRFEWCTVCDSKAPFCMGYNNSADPSPDQGLVKHGLSPVIAGVIGALVAIGFALIVIALAMLIGGIRFHRVHTKRRSDLGGFKGAEKLASDQDLTIPKGGMGAVIIESSEEPRGHERVGSWELREQAKNKDMEVGNPGHHGAQAGMGRSSFDDDIRVNPFADPVKPRTSL